MPAPDYCTPALKSFVTYFESLTPQSLHEIDQFYTPQAQFKDPFNDTTGIDALRVIFEDMFEQLHEPAFRVIEVIEQTDQPPAQQHQAFLVWDFTFRFKSFRQSTPQRIRGSSHITFDPAGQVREHQDYWDAAGELYAKIPVLGVMIRWLRNRLSVG
ncbi:MAG: nuclear transport factor 2 family protein [Burkholderiaceae bacterium]